MTYVPPMPGWAASLRLERALSGRWDPDNPPHGWLVARVLERLRSARYAKTAAASRRWRRGALRLVFSKSIRWEVDNDG